MLLVLFLLVASPVSPSAQQELPQHAAEQQCGGGVTLWFEPNSEQLAEGGRERLLQWISAMAAGQHQYVVGGHFEVEASAPGVGNTFDRELSLRRAATLRRLLIENGIDERLIEVRLNDWFGYGRFGGGPDEEQQANVRRMVVYGRLRHPLYGEAALECF